MRLRQIFQHLLEARSDYILNVQGNKLAAQAKEKEGKDLEPKEVVDTLLQADPSRNQQYIQWIVNQYLSGSFRLEDVSRIKNELTTFEKVKNRLPNKDLNSYTLSSLYDALESVDTEGGDKSKRQQATEIKKEGTEVLINSGNFIALKILNKEAAMYYGKGTKWCTAAEENNMFDSYNNQGPLYVVIVKDGANSRKFQFHVQSDQAMNERDESITDVTKDRDFLSAIPAYTDFLNMLIDKHYEIVDE